MKLKNEADFKKVIKKKLPPRSWEFSPVQTGYGKHGIPDILACVPYTIKTEDVGKELGLFVGIEAKMDGNKPSALQAKQLQDIANAGGKALIATGRKGSDSKDPYVVVEVRPRLSERKSDE